MVNMLSINQEHTVNCGHSYWISMKIKPDRDRELTPLRWDSTHFSPEHPVNMLKCEI